MMITNKKYISKPLILDEYFFVCCCLFSFLEERKKERFLWREENNDDDEEFSFLLFDDGSPKKSFIIRINILCVCVSLSKKSVAFGFVGRLFLLRKEKSTKRQLAYSVVVVKQDFPLGSWKFSIPNPSNNTVKVSIFRWKK